MGTPKKTVMGMGKAKKLRLREQAGIQEKEEHLTVNQINDRNYMIFL